MRSATWAVGLAILVFGGIVFASSATLSDFQAAVQEAEQGHGCASIPYEDLRDACKDSQEKVEDRCKVETRSCRDPAGLIAKAKGLKAKIERLKQDKDDLEKQKEELSDKLGDATDEQQKSELEDKLHAVEDAIEAKDKEIEDKSDILDHMKDKLSKEKDEDEDKADRGKQCVEARTAVRKQFDEAGDAAGDEDDEQIKPLAEKLIDFWNDGKSGHQQAIDEAQRALEKCTTFHDQIGDALGDL